MKTQSIQPPTDLTFRPSDTAQDKSLADRARRIFRKHGFAKDELFNFQVVRNDIGERFVIFKGEFDSEKYPDFINAEREIYSYRLRLSLERPGFADNTVTIRPAQVMLHGSGDD